MARFNIIFRAVLLGLAGRAVGLPFDSMCATGTPSQPIFRSIGLGRDTIRDDDRLERRDFIWTYTRDQDQNLCGPSNFVQVDDNGPLVSACQTLTRYNTDGYWLVSGFSSNASWKRFASVQSCVIAIRRTDGQTNEVPIGNQDVNDLMNSVISLFGGSSDTLPTIQGSMTCSKEYAGTADIEWKIYNED